MSTDLEFSKNKIFRKTSNMLKN